jgi:hypothetical protein
MDRQGLITECWKRGRLRYKLWNAIQRKIEAKFQDCLARRTGILFVNCTRGGGKTNWGVTKTLEYLRHPRIKRPQVFLATAYAEDLRTILIPTFESVMEDKPYQIPIEHIPSKRMYVDHVTKGLAHYRGLDLKRNSLRGNYADLVIIEECQNVRNLAYQWNYVVKQLFRHRPFPMAVFIGTPPETPDHDWVEIMEIAKLNDAYVEATLDEHDMMSAEEKAFMLKDLRPDAIQREYYCRLVIDKTRAIVPEWTDKLAHEVLRDEFFQFYDVYEGMDLGVADQTVNLFGYYDFRNARAVIEDELVMSGPEMTTKLLSDAIKAKDADLWKCVGRDGKPIVKTPYLRIADNNNLLLLNDLSTMYGLPYAAVEKDELHAMVNKVREWIAAGRIIVHPRCKMLLGCLRTGIWDERRKQFSRSNVFGHYDALAALVYLIRVIDESRNPIPVGYGTAVHTHWINPSLGKDSQTARELKKAFRLNR